MGLHMCVTPSFTCMSMFMWRAVQFPHHSSDCMYIHRCVCPCAHTHTRYVAYVYIRIHVPICMSTLIRSAVCIHTYSPLFLPYFLDTWFPTAYHRSPTRGVHVGVPSHIYVLLSHVYVLLSHVYVFPSHSYVLHRFFLFSLFFLFSPAACKG